MSEELRRNEEVREEWVEGDPILIGEVDFDPGVEAFGVLDFEVEVIFFKGDGFIKGDTVDKAGRDIEQAEECDGEV